MNTQTSFSSIKCVIGAAGVISAALALSLPVSAQSESSEIELSPEGLEILCDRFPLNSRCSGEAMPTPDENFPPTMEPEMPNESPGFPDDTEMNTPPREDSIEMTPDTPMDEQMPPSSDPGTLEESPSQMDGGMMQ